MRRTLDDQLVSAWRRGPHVGWRFLRLGDRRVVGRVICDFLIRGLLIYRLLICGFGICGLGLYGLEGRLRLRFVKGRDEGVL